MCACLASSPGTTLQPRRRSSRSPRARPSAPAEERVAVFDNDGTLWCEKPIPIQLDFILRRFAEQAAEEESLRGRQPWKAAYERVRIDPTLDQATR
jgi:hypothetical protein